MEDDENSSGNNQDEEIKNRLTRLEAMVRDLTFKDEMKWREAKEKEKKYEWPPID